MQEGPYRTHGRERKSPVYDDGMVPPDEPLEGQPKPRHRWLFVLMGAILLFFILGGLAFRSYIVSSDNYARETIPKLFKTWDRAALRRELNSEKSSDADVDHIAEHGPKAFGGLQRFLALPGDLQQREDRREILCSDVLRRSWLVQEKAIRRIQLLHSHR